VSDLSRQRFSLILLAQHPIFQQGIRNYPNFGFELYLNVEITNNLFGDVAVLDDDEQNLFEDARERAADAISTLITDGPHPALVCAAILSEVSFLITHKDFWGDERPSRLDFQGYWNLTWQLQEKAFAELADNMPAPSP
jgi:hypothetical protein